MSVAWTALSPQRLLSLVLVIGIFVLSLQPVTDPDLWWHLRTGQLIVDNQTVPLFDLFSFTRYGERWVAHEWLSDVVLFVLHQVGGMNALLVATAVIVTLTFSLVYLMSTLRPRLAAFTTLLAALASAVTWGPRPQMFTMLLAAVTLHVLERARDGRVRMLLLLPFLTVLWANLHSGYFVGLVLVGTYLTAAVLELVLGRNRLSRTPAGLEDRLKRYIRYSALTLALCSVAAVVNPNGGELLTYPFFTLSSRAMQTYIVEWHSPDFHEPRFLPFALLLLLVPLTFAYSARRPVIAEVMLLLGFGYASLVSARNIPFFAIVAAPVVTRQAEVMLAARLQWQATAATPSRTTARVFAAANWLVLTVLLAAVGLRASSVFASNGQVLVSRFPEAAVQYVDRERPAGPLLNSYNFGGYLIWRLYPAYRVFIDGRADVYGDQFMDEYHTRVWQARGDWQDYLDRYGVRLVLMEADSPMATQLRRETQWTLLHEDSLAVVFQRIP